MIVLDSVHISIIGTNAACPQLANGTNIEKAQIKLCTVGWTSLHLCSTALEVEDHHHVHWLIVLLLPRIFGSVSSCSVWVYQQITNGLSVL
eukprot:5506792-Amphidinium_carterae.2